MFSSDFESSRFVAALPSEMKTIAPGEVNAT